MRPFSRFLRGRRPSARFRVARFLAARLVAAAAALVPAGCAHLALDRDYTGPDPRPPEVETLFTYDAHTPAVTETSQEEKNGYTIRRAELAGAVNRIDDRPIVFDHYDLPAPNRPVVVVLPILGGNNKLARHFAAFFARNGLEAVIVHRRAGDKDAEDVAQLNLQFEQMILDHKQVIDWIETQPDIDHDRIGLFGISAGAIRGAIVYALDDRIHAAVLALGGGDLAHILAYSSESGIRKMRERILAEHNIEQDDLYAVIRKEFRHDPLAYAPYMNARNALLILARFDTAVPYETGQALCAAMGFPETVILPTGHYTSFLLLPVAESLSLQFLRARFNEVADRDEPGNS